MVVTRSKFWDAQTADVSCDIFVGARVGTCGHIARRRLCMGAGV